jgi:uncharacterized membrane protein
MHSRIISFHVGLLGAAAFASLDFLETDFALALVGAGVLEAAFLVVVALFLVVIVVGVFLGAALALVLGFSISDSADNADITDAGLEADISLNS